MMQFMVQGYSTGQQLSHLLVHSGRKKLPPFTLSANVTRVGYGRDVVASHLVARRGR